MKVTKFVHACLLVETPERVALFDPGKYSAQAINIGIIDRLDDIFITHIHGDHFDEGIVRQLVLKFPLVRITTNSEVKSALAKSGITASDQAPDGVKFFKSPHESMSPLIPEPPEQRGIHFLDRLTHPGDSHSFKETKEVLALPVSAPWGSTAKAVTLAIDLKPKYILPIHDWHWHDEARQLMYGRFEQAFAQKGIVFYKLDTGVPVVIPD